MTSTKTPLPFPVQTDLERSLAAGLAELPETAPRTIGTALGISSLRAGTHHRTTRRRSFVDWTGQAVAAEKVLPRLPLKGEALHFLLDGSFTLVSVIPVIQAHIGQPCRLTICTLGLNTDTVDLLAAMVRDGRLTALRLAMSSYFAAADGATADYATAILRKVGATLAVERVHAKLQIYAPTRGKDRYVLETSSNLRSCNCIESAMLTNDQALYRWHDRWLTQFFSRHKI